MEITKKKAVAGVVAMLVVIFGATSVTKCPWLKKHIDSVVAPVDSSQ